MVLIIATPCFCERERLIQVTTAAGVLSSLKNYFLNGCVFLLSTEHHTEMSKYNFKRVLFTDLVLSSDNVHVKMD
jgi:hypothetical protein